MCSSVEITVGLGVGTLLGPGFIDYCSPNLRADYTSVPEFLICGDGGSVNSQIVVLRVM